MVKKFIFALSLLAAGAPNAVAQSQGITIKVTSADDGEPVVGAAVVIQDSKVGGVTDVDGQLTISRLPVAAKKLTISYIGMKSQTVTIKGDVVNVVLQPNATDLNEVVVTAMGVTRQKKALGYATQEISSDQLTTGKDNNILNSLSGKLAGVRITNTQGDVGSSRIVIRGETSIAGENQPLFIVDGIPVDNSQLNSRGVGRDFKNAIADLNPEDIQSMSVLKGPNAAALYGARAAHGAIIITTKNGKGQKGLGVTGHVSTQVSFAANLPEFQNLYGQGAGGRFSYVDGKGAGVNDGVDESWGPRLDAGLLIPQFDSPVDANGNHTATPWVSNPNNVNDFFRTGFTSNYGVAIAKSDDKYQFRISYNNEHQKSIVPGASTNKTNFALNTDYKLAKWVSVGATANYILYSAPSLPGSAMASGSNARSNSTMLQFLWFGRQVNTASLKEDYSRNWNSSYYSNPYWNAYYNTQSQDRHRLIGDFHLAFHLLDGLDLRLRTSTDWYNDKRKSKVKWGTSGTPYGNYSEENYTVQENNTEAVLTYQKQISQDWNVDALVGFNVRNKKYEYNYQAAPRLAVPDLYTLTNSRDQLTSSNDFYRLRQYGVYASATVNYKNWAYLSLTGRNDWSSTLPVGNNSYFYPSVTASVLLNEALGFTSRQVNYLKLRGGWSQVGADADPYQLANVYDIQTAFNGNPMLTASTTGKNPNLKPEQTNSTEIGLEGAFFDNRLHLDFSYYQTDSKNQILSLATSAASRYTSQVRNAGHIRNRGYEVQLGIVPIRKAGFEWRADINYSSNRSKVIKLDDEGLITSYQLYSSGIQILAQVGESYGTLFGSSYTRDDKGNVVVDANGLPKISSTSKVLGHFQPDWQGGITNTFRYKRFTFSFLVDASFGGKIFSNTNKTGIYTGVLASTLPGRDAEHGGLWYYKNGGVNEQIAAPQYTTSADGLYYANINGEQTRVYQDGIIVNGVTESGEKNNTVVSAENYYHRLYSIAEANVFSASYVKLREVSFTYQLPVSLARKLSLQDISVALTARNLWIIHKDAPNIDPEVAITSGNAQGVEAYSLPTTRQIGLNLTVKF